MKEIYLYLLLGVLFYFLLSKTLDKYLTSQENFDPSLVPVSSIVTLAKVAQKLVNGNGTLTNPGNLQIGKDTNSSGSLTVTGPTAMGTATPPVAGDPTLKVAGTLNVTGDTTVGNNLIIKGNGTNAILMNARDNSGISQIVSDTAATGIRFYSNSGGKYTLESNSSGKLTVHGEASIESNTNVAGTLGVTGNTTVGGTLGVTGNSTVGGTLGVTGALGVSGNTTLASGSGPSGLKIKNGTNTLENTKIEFGDGSGWRVRFQQSDAKPIMDIVDNQNVDITGNLNVTGDICIDGICINKQTLINLNKLFDGSLYFGLQYQESNGCLKSDMITGNCDNTPYSRVHMVYPQTI